MHRPRQKRSGSQHLRGAPFTTVTPTDRWVDQNQCRNTCVCYTLTNMHMGRPKTL